MSKGDFPFAAPNFIPKLMQDFENKFLNKYTPTRMENTEQLATALAIRLLS